MVLEGLTEFLGNLVISWITTFGYFGIFFVIVLESIIVPIPSEVILPFAGFLAYQDKLNLILVILFATLGSVVASWIAYYIGYYGGIPFFRKYGKYMFIGEKELKHSEDWFKKHGHKAVFFGRMIPGIRSLISIPAGIAKMGIKKFTAYTALGSLPWNVALVSFGFALGPEWAQIGKYMDIINNLVAVGLVIAVVYLIYRFRNKITNGLRKRFRR